MTDPNPDHQDETVADELTTNILIEIRDEIRGTKEEVQATNRRLDDTNRRLDDNNDRLSILSAITRGIDTRLSKMETSNGFLPRRVDVLEQKVQRLEAALDIED